MGETHQNAKLSDAEVARLRADHRQGAGGYTTLGRKYGCGTSTARDIVTYRTRP